MIENDKLRYIPALTGVRAVAAYLVFFHHFNPLPDKSWAWGILNEGHIGVTIFFVLSGFLIPLRYLGQVKFSAHWIKKYFRNRFSRIYPLYLLLTIITFICIMKKPELDPSGQWQGYGKIDKVLVPLLNVTFLRGFFDRFKFTGVAQGWSLTVEETFYFIAIPLLFVLARIRRKYIMLLFSAVVLISIGCLIVRISPHRYGLFNDYSFLFYRTLFGRAFEFMLGAGLSVFIRQHYKVRKGMLVTCAGIFWIFSCVILLSFLSSTGVPSWESPLGIALNNFILPFGIVLFFYGLLVEDTWMSRMLSSSVAQIAGKSSYSFYLIHTGIFSALVRSILTTNIFIWYIIALLLSYAFWRFFEEPLNQWLRTNKFSKANLSNI